MGYKIIHVSIDTFVCYLKMYITIVASGIKIISKGTTLLLHTTKKEKSIFKVSFYTIVHHLYCFVA